MEFLKRFWRRWLFADANHLVKKGRGRILEHGDLLALPEHLSPKARLELDTPIDFSTGRHLVRGMFRGFRRNLVWAYAAYGIAMLLALLQPVLVNRFVGGVSEGLETPEGLRWTMFFGIVLGISTIGRGLLIQQYFFSVLQSYQILTNWLNEKIFRHSLRLTQDARLAIPVGDVVNHMSSDSDTVADLPLVVAELVFTVITILGVVGLLFFYLGWSAVPPLVLLALLVPGTRWLAKRFTHFEDEMMKRRDQRVSLMAQILNAIRVVKYFAWEKSVSAEVRDVRTQEIHARRRMARAEAVSTVTYVAVSSVVLFCALAVHAWRGQSLDPALVFTCVSLFGLLEEPFGGLSWMLSRTMNGFVGAERISKFLGTKTLEDVAEKPASPETGLAIRVAGLSQSEGREFRVEAGECIALVGPVGGGKSTLLMALLGEDPKVRGQVGYLDSAGREVQARTAFVSQEAYIVNGTLRENLGFGTDDIPAAKLREALENSCLEADLRELPAGLETEIGEKGVNLSGGQKQRVSLARAFLAEPQVVFLDDPLSAVDVETEKQLCERLIFGRWRGVTRIVATHRLENLRQFDRILLIDKGMICDQGTYEELLKRSTQFAQFVSDHERTQGAEARAADDATMPAAKAAANPQSVSRITEDEEKESGAVKGSVYWDYFQSLGGEDKRRNWRLVLLLVGAVSVMGLPLVQRWWLGVSSGYRENGASGPIVSWLVSEGFESWLADPISSVIVYGVIGILALGLTLANSLLWLERGLRAGQILHDRMLESLLRTGVRFFDSTPVGRILQRFSRDVESVDLFLQRSFESAIHILIEIILCLALIAILVPWSMVVIIPVLFFYYRIQLDYRAPAREVKRFDSIARSPRYAHFKETLVGLPVIRGFARQDWFLRMFEDKLLESQRMFYNHYLLNRWFSARVPLIGGLISIATTVAVVYSARAGYLGGGTAGLLTIYMLSFWGYLNWGIRVFADIESRMTSVERMRTYTSLPAEKTLREAIIPTSWPSKGRVVFDQVSARYASHLPLVLKEVSFEVPAGQRVGLIGRTGSGKTTLFQTLYRFVELESGRIMIDDIDIATVPLDRLRKSLAIIPQDPTLFMGSIRSNLDRYREYLDTAIWAALKKAHLDTFVRALPDGLEFQVAENGQNLSQGQRQLLCLARALLTGARVLVLDEATASVDVHTDSLLQKVIREELHGVTLLIIAHRLGTVADCDRIVELAGGRIRPDRSPEDFRTDA